jgi:hypothetical protein
MHQRFRKKLFKGCQLPYTMDPEKELEFESRIDRIFDDMLTSTEINICSRPCIRSFDNLNHPISLLVIPTLEDLIHILFEPVYPELEVGYPLKVTGIEDIKSAAFLAQCPPGTLGTPAMISTVISRITKRLSEQLHDFTEECSSHSGSKNIRCRWHYRVIDGWPA